MDAHHTTIAEACLRAAHDGTLTFPEIVDTLVAAGFEGYAVDYRSGRQTYYRPDGGHVALAMPQAAAAIDAALDGATMARIVRWAQANGSDYSYPAFCAQAQRAGCAGYLVSFPGRRVVYYGRTAETHVERFPQ